MSEFSGKYAKKVRDATRASAIEMVVDDLVAAKHSRGGYIDRKILAKAVSSLNAVGVTITKNTLSQKVARKVRKENNAPPTKN